MYYINSYGFAFKMSISSLTAQLVGVAMLVLGVAMSVLGKYAPPFAHPFLATTDSSAR